MYMYFKHDVVSCTLISYGASYHLKCYFWKPLIWFQAKDLLYFVVILMLFVVSYAVAAYAIMYPQSELSVDLFFNVLRLGYWNLYGELLLDDIEGMTFSDEMRERERVG